MEISNQRTGLSALSEPLQIAIRSNGGIYISVPAEQEIDVRLREDLSNGEMINDLISEFGGGKSYVRFLDSGNREKLFLQRMENIIKLFLQAVIVFGFFRHSMSNMVPGCVYQLLPKQEVIGGLTDTHHPGV